MVLKGLTIEEQDFSTTKFFAIGDIHGCYKALEKILSILPVSWGRDYVIFLGDYIDRGPDSAKVIDLIIKLQKKYPDKVIPLKGNHEKMFEDYLEEKNIEIFWFNGGEATLRSYMEYNDSKIPDEHVKFIKNLYYFFETPSYIFVHAGINPEKTLYEQTEEDILWIRESFYTSPKKFSKTIIFGHTPFNEPFVKEDRIGIDTGCVYGGMLTAIQLPERKFFHVTCEDMWRAYSF